MKTHSAKKIGGKSMKKKVTAIICVASAILMVLSTIAGALVTAFA